ncbi:uncharacterized protein LOC127791128 [Diospyros lotus]|uniref:uncharacterized protein LOC127791128 n=1 Tax=Diospyros lotus TaxID=55363 RepID=UPI00224DFA0F|nr:uncharacterized protein LOC127791128 [Diospyros lotus]XP_052176876.1 uncharacterized protein LOC127791128 [Diospyros lotus]
MSLHLGNLSAHVHRDELERVFRRYGRCNVQLKDGYGFVVYDFPSNAEKALRILRGKNICGEPITLSWSNRQPRPLQRFARGNRFNDMQRGRRGEDYVNRMLSVKARRDYKVGFTHQDTDGGRFNPPDTVDEGTSYGQKDIKEVVDEKPYNFREDLLYEGNIVQKDIMDNDRWGERVSAPSNEIGFEAGLEFDRYEPYRDDDDERRDDDGKQLLTHSGSSPTFRKSQDKAGREQIGALSLNHPDGPKSHQACYICGQLGHKMRSCPRENASRRNKLRTFDYRHDNNINFGDTNQGDIKGPASKSQGRLHLGGDAVSMRQRENDRKASRSRQHHRLLRSGNSKLTEERPRRSSRKDYLEKKRRRENGSAERHSSKKPRGLVSSSIHSDYTMSRSRLCSESSRSSSPSNSRSLSSGTRSQSYRSRCESLSQYSRSESSKSRARSRSSSPTSLSLSVSLGRPLPTSPNKMQMNQKDSLVHATCPQTKETSVDAQLADGDAGSDNSKLENMTIIWDNSNSMAPFTVEEDIEKGHPPRSSDEDNCAITKVSSGMKNTCVSLLENDDTTIKSLPQQSPEGIDDIQNSDVVMEQMLAPAKRTDSEALLPEDFSASRKKLDAEASGSSCANTRDISSEELYTVLKHYGLDHPEEKEKDLPAGEYFGSARFWPWEIIYYRRLRKGPISTENYARRIAQNQEFGIVDKYIRSSSGWGEFNPDNF